MKIDSYRVIGVMSGTSLDGIDLCVVSFEFNGSWSFRIELADTIPYSPSWRTKLKSAIELPAHLLNQLDVEYTRFLAETISHFIAMNKITELDAVCSHGHTVLHRPDEGLTYQIGNRPEIGQGIGLPVVCDFRVQDVKLGGQGAPLVPIGDRLLFSEYDVCLNLGGFSNVSFDKEGERIAFDISPVNIVLNELAHELGHEFDYNGELARSGNRHESLFNELNNLAYYRTPPPKSLGLEWVLEEVFPLTRSFEVPVADKLNTFCEHIALQIANQLNPLNIKTVLVTGGGALNKYLIDRIKEYVDANIIIPDSRIIEFKEALVFGLLGVLKLREEINCLKSVTGAKRDHSSGQIYLPN